MVMKINKCVQANIAAKLRYILTLQKADATISGLRENSPQMGQEETSMYAIKDGILYKLEGRDKPSWKTYIPSSLEDEIILNFHTGLGHSGVERSGLGYSGAPVHQNTGQ